MILVFDALCLSVFLSCHSNGEAWETYNKAGMSHGTFPKVLHTFKHCGILFSCCWPLVCPVNRK